MTIPRLVWIIAAVTLPLVFVVLGVVAGWAIDSRAHEGKVVRGVEFLGEPIGGATVEEAQARVVDLADDFASAPVHITTENDEIETTTGALGMRLDTESTLQELFRIGRDESTLNRPVGWLRRLTDPTTATARFSVDTNAAESSLKALADEVASPPVEPTIELHNGKIVTVPGHAGTELDVESLLDQIEQQPLDIDNEVSLTATTTAVEPKLSNDDLEAYAKKLNAMTEKPLTIIAGDDEVTADPEELRSWLTISPDQNSEVGATTDIDEEAITGFLRSSFRKSAASDGGQIQIINGAPVRSGGTVNECCAEGSAQKILAAMKAGDDTVELDLISSAGEPLDVVGIVEEIGSFTTYHPAGQARVTNIHRMAEIIQGAIVDPGDTFSINNYVGRRTTDKGFVPAGVIMFGVLDEDVGGGVSQFATTMFNAAFFAGLDIVQYQAHSIYFERYPYGREATISYPEIDLVIKNTTPNPILLWPTYTDDSITVTIYGTKYASASVSGEWTEPVGQCTKAFTQRTRTYPNGSSKNDTFFALYQPAEGLDCQGQSTVPPPSCGPGEVLIDTTGNGFGDSCVAQALVTPTPVPDTTTIVGPANGQNNTAGQNTTDNTGGNTTDTAGGNTPDNTGGNTTDTAGGNTTDNTGGANGGGTDPNGGQNVDGTGGNTGNTTANSGGQNPGNQPVTGAIFPMDPGARGCDVGLVPIDSDGNGVDDSCQELVGTSGG